MSYLKNYDKKDIDLYTGMRVVRKKLGRSEMINPVQQGDELSEQSE